MTFHCLVEATPYDPLIDTRQTVRFASANLRQITGLGGHRWAPAMIEPPKTSITLFDGDFGAAVKPGAARIPVNLARARPHFDFLDRVYWPGARVEMRVGRATDAWPWPLHFAGVVKTFGTDKGVLGLACEVDEEPFQAEVLTATYAGTGDEEGGADLTGRAKPLVLGHAMNVEPVLIDAVDNVYQFSGYGPIEAVDVLYERASDFGAETADYADHAALVAATIAAGRWATCLAEGMIRLGAPAYGVITGDVRGHRVGATTPRLTGAVIEALAGIAEVDLDLVDTASLDAMDAAAPYNINVVVDSQVRFLEMARRLALPCNHQCGVSLTGMLFAARVSMDGQAAFTLHARGEARPQVLDSKELAVSPPYAKTMLGANRAWRVHSMDEIAFDAPLVPRGLYDDAETYREGNIVTLADGSSWLYINATPSAGNDPPNATYWASLDGATAVDFANVTGATKPEDNADVTRAASGPTLIELAYNSDGSIKTGEVPAGGLFYLTPAGGSAYTTGVTWSVATASGSWSGTAPSISGSGTGELLIESGPAGPEAVVNVTAEYAGATYPPVEVRIAKVQDAATESSGGTGSFASDTSLAQVTNTTWAAISDVLAITTQAGVTAVALTAANLALMPTLVDSGDGTWNVEMKWQRETSPATWTDVAAAVDSDPDPTITFPDREAGQITCSTSATGLSGSTAYTFRLMARLTSGTRNINVNGTASAQG